MSFPIQTLVINPAGEEKHTVGPLDAQVRLVNTDGTAFSAGSGAYELPEAGKDNRHQPCHKNRRQHRFFFPFHPRSVKPDFDPIAD